jgi:hypothetical protein
MGLNFGVFWQTGGYMGADFRAGQSDGFTGVFSWMPRGNCLCDLPILIRRGGAPSGAAEILARGGVGATAPAILSDPSGIFGTPIILTGPAANPLHLSRPAKQRFEPCRKSPVRGQGGEGVPPPHLSIKVGVTLPPCAGPSGGYPLPLLAPGPDELPHRCFHFRANRSLKNPWL